MVSVATKTKRKRKIVLGPKDHGRKMSLDDFDRAITPCPGLYELNKGVIEVADIPALKHGKIVRAIQSILVLYSSEHADIIYYSGSGSDAKVMIAPEQSERHPDISVYLREPPTDDPQPWSEWVPEVVIEVVSESSAKRDYEEKAPEYFLVGVMEYWIVDPFRQTLTVKSRWRATWKDRVLKAGQFYETKLLPGFKLDVRKVLAAAK